MKITVSKKEFLQAIRTMAKTAEKRKGREPAVLRWDGSSRRLGIEFGNCGWELAADGQWPDQVLVHRPCLEGLKDPGIPGDRLELELHEACVVAGNQRIRRHIEWKLDNPLKKKVIPGEGAVQPLLGLALPKMKKPRVFALCQEFVAGANLGHTLWCRRGRWRLEFQLYLRKRNVRYPVVLECRERPERLVLTAMSRDVEREPGDTWAVSWVGKMWKEDHPENPCRLLFRRDGMMIRHSFRYRRAMESGEFYQKFWEELFQLYRPMRDLFPMVAMNDTLIHRAKHRWPDPKRLDW